MGFFKNLTKSVINTALLPVNLVLDSCGVSLVTKDNESLTLKRARKIKESIEDAQDNWNEYWDD